MNQEKKSLFAPQLQLNVSTSEWKLEEVFQQHKGELLGTLFHLLGNLEDAQDALQEGFIHCWKYRDQIDEIVNLRAWVFRVVFNVGRDIRKSAWRKKRRACPEDLESLAAPEKDPQENCVHQEQLQAVQQMIQQLDESEREIFLLRQNGALTYDQIAQVLDIPTGTAKSRMRRALFHLQTMYNNRSVSSKFPLEWEEQK